MNDITLSLEQTTAIDLSTDMTVPIATVTGGAGTGKTTILKEVYNELVDRRIPTVLCAPTGRAAKRIKEATGINAKTIHKLLEFPRPDDADGDYIATVGDDVHSPHLPRRNSGRPLPFRAVLCDESSMVGPELFGYLMDALPRNGVIRLFGDSNQLPPVEGVSPFRRLLRSDPSITLTFNYRSDDEIISNSLRLLQGRIPIPNNRFTIIYDNKPLHTMLRFVTKDFMLPTHQIITPARKGDYGTIRANPSLQLRFNGRSPSLSLDRLDKSDPPIIMRSRDKFLWVKNDYTFQLWNGEIGVVDHLNDESGEMWLGMEDRPVLLIPPRAQGSGPYGKYWYDPRKQIEPGYVITTHKSQGSEFDCVVYYMTSAGKSGWLLNRNNFYTAITRAKKHVIVICDMKAMGKSIRNKAEV